MALRGLIQKEALRERKRRIESVEMNKKLKRLMKPLRLRLVYH